MSWKFGRLSMRSVASGVPSGFLAVQRPVGAVCAGTQPLMRS